MQHLSVQFGVSVASVNRIIHKVLPVLHSYMVRRFIKWPSINEWNSLQGTLPLWPRVVGIMDGTPFRISKPTGISFSTNVL